MSWLKLFGILAVPVLGVMLIMSVWNVGTCKIYGAQTDRETKYGAFVGCMVKVNNQWVPRNELRVTQ
jgi:hypothetical protein